MVQIPLIIRLKKARHRKIAAAQDAIIYALYKVFDNAVLHGGTGIWRCYHGNRFSEDVDVYIPRNLEKIEKLFEEFKKAGLEIEKKKISGNSIYSELNFNGVAVGFEALFRKIEGNLKDYETAEGSFITIHSLEAEDFVKEKAETYLKRRKIRDLYDVFFLLRFSERDKVREEMRKLIDNYSSPVDEEDLKAIILEGICPSSGKMIEYIKSYLK